MIQIFISCLMTMIVELSFGQIYPLGSAPLYSNQFQWPASPSNEAGGAGNLPYFSGFF
jgi:hypothetical protein